MKELVVRLLGEQRPDLEDVANATNLDDVLDSMDVITLVSALEDEYGIEIDPEDIVPENFASVDAMVTMLESYVEGA